MEMSDSVASCEPGAMNEIRSPAMKLMAELHVTVPVCCPAPKATVPTVDPFFWMLTVADEEGAVLA